MSPFNNQAAIYLRNNAVCIGKGSIKGKLYLVKWDFDYPALVINHNSQVFGELYQLKSFEVLKHLDIYEGSEYIRQEIEVIVNKKRHKAIAYVFNSSINHLEEILSGDFLTP